MPLDDHAPPPDLADRPVRRAEGLYLGIVRGRRFVHNPRGRDALALLSRDAAALLDLADGRTLRELAAALQRPVAALARELSLLARNGFVQVPGLPAAPRPPGPPSLDLWVHVTNACNLDCPYCYIEKDGRSLSEDTARSLQSALLATVRADGVRAVHLRFAGGEPLLRFEFIRDFFEETRALLAREGATLSAAVLTNGTRVPDGAAQWMREHGVSVSVSIDGVGAAQDAMRPSLGGGGSWADLERGLDAFSVAGVRPYALVTVGAANLDGVPALTDWLLAREMGFRYSLVRDLDGGAALLDARLPGWRPSGGLLQLRRRSAPVADAPPMLEGDALARVLRVFGECYDRIERAMPVRPSFRRTHRFCDLQWRHPIGRACAAGERSLAVSHDGRISACQAALHHEGTAALAGDTALLGLAPAVMGPSFQQRSPGAECQGCRFRHSCAGGCPLLLHRRDGHADGRSPYCEVFRSVLPRILRIAALELALDASQKPG
jgi:uncharacterized protein